MCSVTLHFADSNGNQTLGRPINEIMLLVENEIDSPTNGAIRRSQNEALTSWEAPDEMIHRLCYNLIISGAMA